MLLADRHVRVERVGLEHHRDAALDRGGTSFTSRPSMKSSPRGDLLQPGDHPQQRGLAAAGRADEDDELAVGDVEVEFADDLQVAVLLAGLFKLKS